MWVEEQTQKERDLAFQNQILKKKNPHCPVFEDHLAM
jgi:hypothetical protein